jgi:mRNA-degrading endonuclease RelE of RelBE toxin-antitoxin system
MKYIFLERFISQLESFPIDKQNKFYKQLNFLLNNLRHPSLHAKKYDETKGIWQARVDKNIRFYFQIDGETYILLEIERHPK